MIKKILIAAIVAIPMCLSAQTLKFGTVNTQQIFEAMPEKSQAETTLNEISKKYQDEFDVLNNEGQKKYTEFQALDENTPQSIKERRIQEMQEIQAKIEEFQKMATQDIQKQQEQLLAPIMQKIQQAVQSVGSENGYTFIFEMSPALILYAGATAEDVTSLVKTKLGLK
ncbi:MAG: OmpH family outer membrane protein [Muribaculaceae bacterium]|nr:OmpH family outer membrane protein [Muribaculaceae bacterium]